MVRTFEYTTTKEEALKEAQIVFEKLGYKISSYDEVDNYFTTELRIINRLFRPIYYVTFVTAQDRLTVIVYSEVRTFRRASRVGFASGSEQVMQDASNNLGDRFQRAIFNPVTEAIERKGFATWDRVEDSQQEDVAIREAEDLRQMALTKAKELEKAYVSNERQKRLKAYNENQEEQRFFAMREGEHHIEFWPKTPNWSIVAVSKILQGHRAEFDSVFRDVLMSHRDVSGKGAMLWILGPDGRVADVRVLIRSSFNTPENDLRDRLISTLRSVYFNDGEQYLRLRQGFSFEGNYHNLKIQYERPIMTGIFPVYPVPDIDVLADTFFVNWPKQQMPAILKN